MNAPAVIPYGRQHVDQDDIDAVTAVLQSDWLTQGPVVPAFETAMASRCHAQHAVAVNSATSALHLACLALGVGPGDLVWTSPISFVASANCALYCGADVDFVDIDPDTCNLSPAVLRDKLLQAQKIGRLPKVVIPVHLCGRPCDMETIHALAMEFGFKIIEDASHAVGAHYMGQPVGNCRYSDIAVFSFHPVKVITSAEGGMALTNNPVLAQRMSLLRSHGITREPAQLREPNEGPWYYEQIELGWNYRMTEIQAALGLSQLTKLDAFVQKRTSLARRYDDLLSHANLKLPTQETDSASSHHLYVVRVSALERRRIFESLRQEGIGVNVHYIPIYKQPFYRSRSSAFMHCPEAENYYSEAISLPLFPQMEINSQEYIANTLRNLAKVAI